MVDKTDPVCGMKGHIKAHGHYFCSQHCIKTYEGKQTQSTSKVPVIILVSILVAALVLSITIQGFMQPFMGVFFVIVAILKLADVNGFVMGFRQYDLLAMRSKLYAQVYPFLELVLGILFLTNTLVVPAAILTALIMFVGVVSVAKTLREKKKLKCACLGALIAVPLTTFTLAEDSIMLIMAIMLLL